MSTPKNMDVIVRYLSDDMVEVRIHGDAVFCHHCVESVGMQFAGDMALRQSVGLYVYDQGGVLLRGIGCVESRRDLR